MITQANMILICQMGPRVLGELVAGKSWRNALALRRDLQVAMTEFARTHSSAEHQPIKDGFVTITGALERACREKFTRNRTKKLSSLGVPFETMKGQIKVEFESILKQMSY